MSRHALEDLIRACERSPSLRRSLHRCNSTDEWIEMARSKGFAITQSDLNEDSRSTKIQAWFDQSRIETPFRRA